MDTSCAFCDWHKDLHGIWSSDRIVKMGHEDPTKRRPCLEFVPKEKKK